MPRADDVHYKLLKSALAHISYAVDTNAVLAAQMKATALRSISNVRQAAIRAGDRELQALCESAERVLGH